MLYRIKKKNINIKSCGKNDRPDKSKLETEG